MQSPQRSAHFWWCTNPQACNCPSNKYLVLIILAALITSFQCLISITGGSAAVLSDAIHTLSDKVAYIGSWMGERRIRLSPHKEHVVRERVRKLHVTLLFLGALIVIYEGWGRDIIADRVIATWMLQGGLLGLVGNGIQLLLLRALPSHDITHHGSLAHVVSDFAQSLLVVGGASVIIFMETFFPETGGSWKEWLDASLATLAGFYMLLLAWRLYRHPHHEHHHHH